MFIIQLKFSVIVYFERQLFESFIICFYLQKQRQGNLITNTSSYYQKLRKKKHDIQDVLVVHVLHVLAKIEFFDTLGHVVGLPSIYHLPVVTGLKMTSGKFCCL